MIDLQQIPLIAGSVGPFGAALLGGSEYKGNYVNNFSVEEMLDWHKPRIKALIDAGVDLIAFEAMPAFIEAEMLLNYIKSHYPQIKAWLSFGCKDEEHTNFGESFQEVARKCYDLAPDQLIAVGVNCTNPKFIEKLFSGLNDNRENKIPLIVYPNSGEVYNDEKG